MVTYYYFCNRETGESNQHNIFDSRKYVVDFDFFDRDDMISIFKKVINVNNWDNKNIVRAYADRPEHSSIEYLDDEIEFIPCSESGDCDF